MRASNPSNPQAKGGLWGGGFVVSFSKQELRTLEKTQGSLMPLVSAKLFFNSDGHLMFAKGPGLLPKKSWAILIARAKHEADKSGVWSG